MPRKIKPFDDSQEKDRRRSSTNSSTDTSPVDAFRQGVELTRTVHYANGIAKIHSGYNGQSGNHEVPQFVLGQDRPSHRDENSFLEGIRLDPLTRFEDGYSTAVAVVSLENTIQTEGVEDILTEGGENILVEP